MPITTEQLRAALADLNGQRDVRFVFEHGESCIIHGALIVPAEGQVRFLWKPDVSWGNGRTFTKGRPSRKNRERD
jgi:hypothetical protein